MNPLDLKLIVKEKYSEIAHQNNIEDCIGELLHHKIIYHGKHN